MAKNTEKKFKLYRPSKLVEGRVQDVLEKFNLKHSYLRCDLLFFLFQASKPVTVPQILNYFSERGKAINKTSVYREIEKLYQLGAVKEVILSGDTKSYEPSDLSHHHHLVCKNCGLIEDVSSDSVEAAIHELEELCQRSKGFKVLDHAIELFGLCSKCK